MLISLRIYIKTTFFSCNMSPLSGSWLCGIFEMHKNLCINQKIGMGITTATNSNARGDENC